MCLTPGARAAISSMTAKCWNELGLRSSSRRVRIAGWICKRGKRTGSKCWSKWTGSGKVRSKSLSIAWARYGRSKLNGSNDFWCDDGLSRTTTAHYTGHALTAWSRPPTRVTPTMTTPALRLQRARARTYQRRHTGAAPVSPTLWRPAGPPACATLSLSLAPWAAACPRRLSLAPARSRAWRSVSRNATPWPTWRSCGGKNGRLIVRRSGRNCGKGSKRKRRRIGRGARRKCGA